MYNNKLHHEKVHIHSITYLQHVKLHVLFKKAKKKKNLEQLR